jgi:hypothetical protein
VSSNQEDHTGYSIVRLDTVRGAVRDLRTALGHPYVAVFAIALALRLLLFYVASVQAESLESFATTSPDGLLYVQAATEIASHGNWTTQGVQVFGPGYPALLAAVGFLSSHHPAWLVFCQLFVGAMGSVLVSLVVFQLFRDRTIATWAGIINATSIVAISLSNALLSDCVFLVVVLAGLYQIQRAAAEASLFRSLAAGLFLGSAILIRSAGLAVLLLLPFMVLHAESSRERPWFTVLWASRRILGAAVLVSLALAGAWAWRNSAVYGAAFVSKAGAVAQVRMSAAIQHQIDGTDPEVALGAISDTIETQARTAPVYDRAYLQLASDHFWKRVKEHPGASLRSFWHTTDEAVHTDWGVILSQLPKWDPPIRDAIHWSELYPIRYRAALLSLAGLVMLLFQRRYRLAVTLTVAYALFALTAGLTLWQGNRIFYPGQIGWAPLAAVAIVTPVRWIRTGLARRVDAAHARRLMNP